MFLVNGFYPRFVPKAYKFFQLISCLRKSQGINNWVTSTIEYQKKGYLVDKYLFLFQPSYQVLETRKEWWRERIQLETEIFPRVLDGFREWLNTWFRFPSNQRWRISCKKYPKITKFITRFQTKHF